ncbi:MAG: hypothetical protein MZV70_37490, partial [Desulfobacterales bacterium]|nr:hypothetical protein [Desulfobacterales bacterium]
MAGAERAGAPPRPGGAGGFLSAAGRDAARPAARSRLTTACCASAAVRRVHGSARSPCRVGLDHGTLLALCARDPAARRGRDRPNQAINSPRSINPVRARLSGSRSVRGAQFAAAREDSLQRLHSARLLGPVQVVGLQRRDLVPPVLTGTDRMAGRSEPNGPGPPDFRRQGAQPAPAVRHCSYVIAGDQSSEHADQVHPDSGRATVGETAVSLAVAPRRDVRVMEPCFF